MTTSRSNIDYPQGDHIRRLITDQHSAPRRDIRTFSLIPHGILMKKKAVHFSVYIPTKIYKTLRSLHLGYLTRTKRLDKFHRNLAGERNIETSFIAANLPEGGGAALDFGCGESVGGLIAARRGYDVSAIDLREMDLTFQHPNLSFCAKDIFDTNYTPGQFSLIINCSVIEHVGLSGRYGIKAFSGDLDLDAMKRLHRFLSPSGLMLITFPVGEDGLFPPLARVYGRKRIPRLFSGFDVTKEEYWLKDLNNKWVLTDKERALSEPSTLRSNTPYLNYYGLGCFCLKKQ